MSNPGVADFLKMSHQHTESFSLAKKEIGDNPRQFIIHPAQKAITSPHSE